MIPIGRMSTAELIAHVQSRLREGGVETVLSGGTCVSLWSANAYRSDDVDLIPEGFGQRVKIRAIMADLGFAEKNRYFVHPDTTMWFEFPSGPLAVGEERPRKIEAMKTRAGVVRLLSPTDCVKDRLTWWFHNADRQCLEQAIMVAKKATVDVDELKRWAKGEGKTAEMEVVAARMVRTRRRRR